MADAKWAGIVWAGDHDRAAISRAVGRGTLRRLAAGIYTGDSSDAQTAALVARAHGVPFDSVRLQRFETLAAQLRDSDITATYEAVFDTAKRRSVPTDGDSFVALLLGRHGEVMGGLPTNDQASSNTSPIEQGRRSS
jgi:hypothetical protein